MAFAAVEASDVERAVGSALSGDSPAILAVSGGMDSMVLLTAASRLPSRARRQISIATFDHGTGKAAGAAAALVVRCAAAAGFPCVIGRATTVGTREEEWRRGSWGIFPDGAAQRRAGGRTASHPHE